MTNQQQFALAIWAVGVVAHLFVAVLATSASQVNPIRFLSAIIVALIWPLTLPFFLGMSFNPSNQNLRQGL